MKCTTVYVPKHRLLIILVLATVCCVVALNESERNSKITNYNETQNTRQAFSSEIIESSESKSGQFLDKILVRKCGRMDRCFANKDDPWDGNGTFYRLLDVNFQLNPYFCRCDEICTEYGDCCPTIVQKSIQENPWKCSKLQAKTWALMISSCSSLNTDKNLEMLCTMESIWASASYHIDVPFYTTNGKFYRNIYCALCNGVKVEDIKPLKIQILCNKNVSDNLIQEFEREALYEVTQRYWKHFDTHCAIYIPEYDATQINKTNPHTRYCGPAVIDYCPQGTDQLTVQLCSSYTQHIESRQRNVYKNPYCAQCHDVNIPNDINCYIRSNPIPRIDPDVIYGGSGTPLNIDNTCQLSNLLQKLNDTTDNLFIAHCNVRQIVDSASSKGSVMTVLSTLVNFLVLIVIQYS